MHYCVTVSIGTKDCKAAIRLHANCLVVCVMKCKLGLPQKRGKLYLSKSHRINGAVIQIIFLTKKREAKLCKDVLRKETDLLVYVTFVLLHKQLQIKFANQ